MWSLLCVWRANTHVFRLCVCVCAVRSWASLWRVKVRAVLGFSLSPPTWVNPSWDWTNTQHCSKSWRDTWRCYLYIYCVCVKLKFFICFQITEVYSYISSCLVCVCVCERLWLETHTSFCSCVCLRIFTQTTQTFRKAWLLSRIFL